MRLKEQLAPAEYQKEISMLILRRLLILLLFIPMISWSQNSGIQDSEGKSTIFNGTNNGVTLNFADAKIGFSRSWVSFGEESKLLGFEGNFKTSDGISKILSKGDFVPAGDLGAFYIKRKEIFRRNDDQFPDEDNFDYAVYDDFILKGALTGELFTLMDSTGATSKDSDIGFSFTVGYNRLGKYLVNEDDNNYHSYIFGTSISFSQANNLSTLKKHTLQETTVIGSQPVISDETTVYSLKEDFEEKVFEFRHSMDYLYLPYKLDPIGFYIYNRFIYKNTDDNKIKDNLGFGIALMTNKDNTKVAGALGVEFNDLFDSQGSSDNFDERIKINLVVGYPF